MYGQKNFIYFLLIILFVWKSITASPISYDQRQTGDVNVQIDVEDVQVVAFIDKELLDDYVDYDYAYNYADFTVKPITKPTTTLNSTTTVKPWSTWPTKPPTSLSTSSTSIADIVSTTSDKPLIINTSPSSSSSLIAESENISTTILNESNVTSTTPQIDTTTSSKVQRETLTANNSKTTVKDSDRRCRRGTLPNGNGRCRKINRRRTSLLPLTMKFAPKITEVGDRKDLRIVSWITPRT